MEQPNENGGEKSLEGLIAKFRRRAEVSRALAYFVLFLISITLAGGVYLFVIAGDIVSREAAAAQKAAFEQFRELVGEIAPEIQAIFADTAEIARAIKAASNEEFNPLLDEAMLAVKEITETAGSLRDSSKAVSADDLRRDFGHITRFGEDLAVISGEIEKAIDPAKVAAILTAIEQLSDNLAKASAETPGSFDRLIAEEAASR